MNLLIKIKLEGRTIIVRHTHRTITVQASQTESLKYPKRNIRTTIKRLTQRMIVIPRPPGVHSQKEQQLHGIRTEGLLYGLPSELTIFCRQSNQTIKGPTPKMI